jgi:hypothetical protein
MKIKSSLLLLFFATFCGAQTANDKVVFLDSLWIETTEGNHKYYRVIEGFAIQKPEYQVITYYKSGKIQMKGTLDDKYTQSRSGVFTGYYENGNRSSFKKFEKSFPIGDFYTWYDNGKLRSEGEYLPQAKGEPFGSAPVRIKQYWTKDGVQKVKDGSGYYKEMDLPISTSGKIVNGLKDSIWTGCDFKLKITFSEQYQNGELVSGESKDMGGILNKYSKVFVSPKPKNGLSHFYEYISKNFRRPTGETGKLIVKFLVETDGSISHFEVLKSAGTKMDEEAKKVVSAYGSWDVGTLRGVKIPWSYSLPITIM